MSGRIVLIVEDEAAVASALATLVRRIGLQPVTAASAAVGIDELARGPALVVLDIGLPDRSGIDVLADIRARAPDLPVLVVTAHGNLGNAVEAKKRGASGYLVKPLDLREVEATLRSLLAADAQNALPAAPPTAPTGHAPVLIGSAASMQPAFAAIAHACASDVPVLITGPTGIGKSLTARVVHLHSARQARPFVTLSCASLPASLLEAELFGHERGSFTGADAERIGHVERAAGGTLFLDEIGEVPLELQVKLLRVVEDKVFTRVGGREERRVDVRIIAATNQDLPTAVAERRFREDLYYRLRVLEVRLPPLRERLPDLPSLCAFLLGGIGGERTLRLAEDALQVLLRHDWPGNVRELRNVLEHAAAVCGGSLIVAAHLPMELRGGAVVGGAAADLVDGALRGWLDERLAAGASWDALHDELEARLLQALLPRFSGKPTLLARALDMNRATLRKKLRAMGTADADEGDED